MAMDFIGTGTRLKPEDLLEAADKLMTGVAVIRAVVEVEAAGAGFDDKRRPKILFEPHIFYKQLGPGSKRDQAVQQGLAYRKQGTKPYPPLSKRYDQIARAMAIDETAALNSASWGLPQIMGFNFKSAGFTSAKAMVTSMMKGEREQLLAFANLLIDWKLAEKLRKREWKSFALKYNGPAGPKNGYDKKLAKAFDKFSKLAARAVAVPGTNRTFVAPSGFT
jgi:hypothetical protein